MGSPATIHLFPGRHMPQRKLDLVRQIFGIRSGRPAPLPEPAPSARPADAKATGRDDAPAPPPVPSDHPERG